MPIVALIPARNEPDIGSTVDSIFRQSYLVDEIFVLTNNCTDDGATKRIAEEHGATVIDLGVISGRKAGALNAGLHEVLKILPDTELILQMDADSILGERFLELTLSSMLSNEKIGGLGASFLAQKKPGKNLLGDFLVWGQRQEYAHNQGGGLFQQVSVLSGTASLLRVAALIEVDELRGFVWNESSLVEDYELTKALTRLDWLCMTDAKFVVYTDVMTSWPEFIQQRLRWQRGTLQTIFKDYRGLRCVRKDAWQQRLSYALFLPHLTGYILMFLAIMLSGFGLSAFVVVWVMLGVYHGWSTRKAGIGAAILAALIIPLELYNFVRYLWFFKSWRLYRTTSADLQSW